MIEKYVSLFFLLFSLTYFNFARGLTFGSFSSPKAGFLPIIIGTLGTCLAAIDFIGVLRKSSKDGHSELINKKVLLFFLILILYTLFLRILGYPIATFLAVLLSLKITDTKGWIVPLLISVCIGLGFYFMFKQLLGVMLPSFGSSY